MALAERYEDHTIASVLAQRATADPGAPFLFCGDAVFSYGEVDAQAEALAASLANLGIGSGDRIAILLPAAGILAITVLTYLPALDAGFVWDDDRWLTGNPAVVGDGSWLGHGTVVLPGATIGRHVVVGANSVVTGELPDNCVAAGVPARVIKTLS